MIRTGFLLIGFVISMLSEAVAQFTHAPVFDIVEVYPTPLISSDHPGSQDNTYGFEGGRVLKVNGKYYLFTTEMSGLPIWGKTRLALWESKNGFQWNRVSTLFESSGEFAGKDTHAALWSPMPMYDSSAQKWILTYVCYRSKPNTDSAWYRNYDGRIALAISSIEGMAGLKGPYIESGFIMEPDTLQPELGLMGVDSFFPYQVKNKWLAFYGTSPEWNGLAEAPALKGPWKRIETAGVVSRHTENPIVQKIKDDLYVAFFDGCGVHQKFGYMVSSNGRDWSAPIIINLDKFPQKWWGLSRTPLGFTSEPDGTFRLYFTAYNKNFYDIPGIWQAKSDSAFDCFFASVGMITLRLRK